MKISIKSSLLLALAPAMICADTPKPAAPANQPTKLELPANATRDQVKDILKKQGLATTDEQLDGIMAKIQMATTQPTQPNDLHEFVKNLPSMELEYSPMFNQHQAKGLINDQPVTFIIDSGAHSSLLATHACERLGLKTEKIGTGRGIGGEETTFETQFNSMAIGPHIKFPAQKMRSSSMTHTRENGNVADGLIGADILTQLGAIIDFQTHRFAYPDSKNKPDLSALAKASGYQELSLTKNSLHSVLEVNIKGKPARFIIDTGAQQSVLDSSFAKRLGLPLIPTALQVQGIGAQLQSAQLTSIEDITIGDNIKLHRTPMLVMPLNHVQNNDENHFDGILGAEFLFATGAVFDVGNQKLYIKPGLIDVRSHTKTGAEMFNTDEELKQIIATTPRILAGKIKTIGVMEQSTTDKSGQVWKLVRITADIDKALKGESVASGTEETIHVLVKDEPNLAQSLSGSLGRNPGKIFFLGEPSDGKTASATSVDRVIWTDGELPRTQLKRLGINN